MKTTEIKRKIKSNGIKSVNDQELASLIKVHDPIMKEAIVEYFRRSNTIERRMKITASRDAFDLLKYSFTYLDVEHFYLMTLTRSNHTIGIKQIAIGGQSGCVVDIKVIIRQALMDKACGIIVAHNHPSGNLKPSDADMRLTQNLKSVCTMMEMPLLDHLIIHADQYYSFADEGKL